MTDPLVSIVIPTFNNQDTIAICLESIKRQTYDEIETIVVDGGSSDLTRDICKTYNINVIESSLGMSDARLRGAKSAAGRYLFHIDSDMELTENVVEECVERSKRFDALIIPETNVGETYWARCTDIGKKISRRQNSGNLRFLPRETYHRVGGHNPRLLGKEDAELDDLVRSEGSSVDCIESKIRHHIGRVRFVDIVSRRWKYIRSLSDYRHHSRVSPQPQDQRVDIPTSKILLGELFNRPTELVGYVILSLCTAILARTQEITDL